MSQNINLSCKGLFTYPNNLSAIPEGSLVVADNIYIDRNDVAQPRRGFKVFSVDAFTTLTKSIHNYQNRLLVHDSDVLQYETDPAAQPGVFTIYEESVDGVLVDAEIESPDNAAGLKIKSTEANRNFYYTTSKGIMKIDNVANTTLRSGVPQALDFDLELVDQDGFLLQDSTVAYRVVWGYKDANNNLLLSAPSGREVIYYYGVQQFIDDVNAMLTEIALQGATFTGTYPTALSSTATLPIIYSTMKEIVKALNQESALAYKEYEAGGTINITNITTRPKSAIPASSYFIFSDNNGRFVPWFDVAGGDPAPNLSLQPDLQLTDTLIEVDLTTVVDPNDASQVATILHAAIAASAAEVTLELSTNNLILRTLYDQVIPATVDGDDASGNTFETIQAGTELSDLQATLVTLQEAFDIIVTNLNEDDPPVDPDFVEATTSKAVSLYITIPSDIINLSQTGTNFFYQVYRSALYPLSDAVVVVPNDELQLVYENNPTSGEITAGFVGPFTDETTEDLRAGGALLYNNPSQEGILQSNYQPPLAKDIALYKNQVYFANTINKYSLQLDLLTGQESTAGAPGFTASTQAVLVNQTITYRAKQYGTPGNAITIRLLDPATTNAPLSISVVGNAITANLATDGAGAITTTRAQLVAAINLSAPASALITATGAGGTVVTALAATPLATGTSGTIMTFDNGTDDFDLVWIASSGADDFENGVIALIDPTAGTVDTGDDISPSQMIEQMAQKIVKAVNRHTSNPFLNAYYTSSFDELPGQINFETRYLENPIFTVEANSALLRTAFSPELESPDAVATNETSVNRVYFSKYQQPESVPSLNYFDIGAGDKGIIRIIASRDSLFVFKEDGLFTISGQEGSPMQVNGLDNTCKIKGPETPVVGNNQIYLFTDEGITRVTEAGPEVISQQIADKLNALPNTSLFTGLNKAAFGVYYDTEKKYYCWLPTVSTDQVATQCFVWNTSTETWTRLPISKTCGIINSRDNKMYLGAGDVLHIEQERKNFNLFDYADRQYTNQIQDFSYDDYTEQLTLELQSVADLQVGDTIQQTEYLNPYYFNRILTMLDTNGNTESDYYSTLGVTLKSEILTNLEALADKLDADPGVTDTDYRANIDAVAGTTPVKVLEKFNVLVEQMNTDTGIDESNFPTVDETYTFYSHIIEVDEATTSVVVQDNFDFEVGSCTTYEAIDTLITWAPNHAGNPAIWKHFRESNMMFSEVVLRELEIGFASDVSRNFEVETFTDDSLAGWGLTSWGLEPWGSDPEPRTYRTYIPRLKQRSRYLNTQFEHSRAFEYYLLNGVSISYDNLTERVTR